MNCPICKHPTSEHGDNHLIFFDGGQCLLTEIESLRAAQRAAAIAHLREIVARRNKFKDRFGRRLVGWVRLDGELWAAIDACRAIEVLPRERKP